MAKAKYSIGGDAFTTKAGITERCRKIRDATPDGALVAAAPDVAFLLDLFGTWHDEWDDKTAGGFVGFTTMTVRANGRVTRCFAIQSADDDQIDISFPHAIRRIETARTATLIPQALRDFRNAARIEVARQTMNYRATALSVGTPCSVTGLQLTASNCAVDHHGRSFDELLFAFCQLRSINPLKVQVGSVQGVQARFVDRVLAQHWQSYHQQHAQLRLIEKTANLKIPKVRRSWDTLTT
ncbi:MAG: DUF3223 domain-containing protein [Bradyrhizobium sp.]|uniref:DUF3223 domain-containing protein n=1 Tax=Bradyrhizobium sp. TaxID=376 RepID=UPI0025BC4795|nr:DUF3223 domain-containing protein [Bradyrhizobium sp.]MBI5263868.1 DUF3223 domain-containing protein [Bradyrhizobium sp.]